MHKATFAARRIPERGDCLKDSPEDVTPTFFALCKNIDTPHSLAAWLMCKYDQAALVDLKIDPANYGDARLSFISDNVTPKAFAYDLLVTEFLSKFKGFDLGYDLKDKAISSFIGTERRVQLVNRHLREFRRPQTARLEAIISIARRKISEILGERSKADFSFGWGPGSTFSVKGDVGWDKKILEKRISVTASALPLAQTVVGADIHWCRARGIDSDGPCSLLPGEFEIVSGNSITTVPKNAKTDRTIAIEPSANVYLQKGIGSWMRRRLKSRCRINLDSQELNQSYAGKLSYATIDLSAASDSVSLEVVRLLLPDEWVFLLDAIRSPNYKLDGKWHRYEKWSSMGNGYTFELETLLFWALCTASLLTSNDDCHVITYGDDILVPVDGAVTCIQTLEDFGFLTNAKKTHYAYLYRESCGAHFYDGFLVTPVYQKEELNHVEQLYHMANRLRHFATRLGGYHYSDSIAFPAWNRVVRTLTKYERPGYTPLSFTKGTVEPINVSYQGALHLSMEDCESLGLPIRLYGSKSVYHTFVPKKRIFDPAAGLALTMHNQSSFEGEEDLALRGKGRVRKRKKRCFLSFGSNVWL